MLADLLYVLTNSALFVATGRLVPRPWDGTFESVQSSFAMRRAIASAGFLQPRCASSAGFLVASGRKPGELK